MMTVALFFLCLNWQEICQGETGPQGEQAGDRPWPQEEVRKV